MVGRDLILRSGGFQVAFLSAAGVASRMGTAQIGAHQIALQLWEFIALVAGLVRDRRAIAGRRGARRLRCAVAAPDRLAGGALRPRWPAWCSRLICAAGWRLIPAVFTSSAAVRHQAHLLWPWFVGMLPVGGVVFALDGVLIGAGDVAFLRTITLIAAVGAFVPLNLAALPGTGGSAGSGPG